jgi:lysophospholipase L1-like esterase
MPRSVALWTPLLALAGSCVSPTASEDREVDDPGIEWDLTVEPFTGLENDTGADTDSGPSDFERCFQDIADPSAGPGPNYDQFAPTVGSHCYGTDHQDIIGVERVVFLGDSVTVGTPPTEQEAFYRSVLADALADEFGLDRPGWLWQAVNLLEGTSLLRDSGDFSSCAEWGARADDLMRDGTQVEDCFPLEERDLNTLVIVTIGGNDLSALTEGFIDGDATPDLWAETEEFMTLVREAVEWLTGDPTRFPNGIHVILTNLYEFTDATGDVTSCPGAALAGYGSDIEDPALPEMVVWSMEQYMSIAVDTGTDMLFLLETFCGHGYNRDDPNGRCYRGPDAELWFDLTCIHPNPRGHEVIAEMFLEVVRE